MSHGVTSEQSARPRRELALRILRFAMVGGLCSILYLLFAWWLIQLSAVPAVIGTAAAYLLVVPINFLLQKHFTFRSSASLTAELPRFLLVHGMNLALSVGIMALVVTWWGLSPIWGMLATVVIVPLVVYLALDLWVFCMR